MEKQSQALNSIAQQLYDFNQAYCVANNINPQEEENGKDVKEESAEEVVEEVTEEPEEDVKDQAEEDL